MEKMMEEQQSLTALCRTWTDLTAKQQNRLELLQPFLPFIADLSMGQVQLAVCTKQAELLILAEYQPQTAYLPPEVSDGSGQVSALQQNPLLACALRENRSFSGKYEWQLGRFLPLEVLPLAATKQAYAALAIIFSNDDFLLRKLFLQVIGLLVNIGHITLVKPYERLAKDEGVLIASKEQRIIYANFAARHICHALGTENLAGLTLFDKKWRVQLEQEITKEAQPHDKEQYFKNGMIVRRREIALKIAGQVQLTIIRLQDMTVQREQEKQAQIQAAVLKETHHRVKNHLQMVAGLLRLQARRSDNLEVKRALTCSIERISSIAAAHELLTQGKVRFEIGQLMERMVAYASKAFLPSDFRLQLLLPAAEIDWQMPSGNLALVLNELVSNSVQHGFRDKKAGTIAFSLAQQGKDCHLEYHDDGCGLPEGFAWQGGNSLGLQLINTLIVDDLGGQVYFSSGSGVHVHMRIPLKK